MFPDGVLARYRDALLALGEQVDKQIEALAEWCDPVAPDVALGRLTRNDAMQDQQMAMHQRERCTSAKDYAQRRRALKRRLNV